MDLKTVIGILIYWVINSDLMTEKEKLKEKLKEKYSGIYLEKKMNLEKD